MFKESDNSGGMGDLSMHPLDGGDGLGHARLIFLGSTIRIVGCRGGAAGVTSHLFHRGAHLVHGGGHLISTRKLVANTLAAALGDGAKLLGGGIERLRRRPIKPAIARSTKIAGDTSKPLARGGQTYGRGIRIVCSEIGLRFNFLFSTRRRSGDKEIDL
ncbi:hypothetical protein [Pseudomonas oryzihabitans]|uniref:hypothetical protein n=1 Tax=Pseudomonas oryzihabitans TaxID=47885 RepID=UPI001FD15167|nr:hypothetical protein [Pseudomonas psychrotolerans]